MEIREFIRKEVSDWDEESVGRARFKELSGQRSDWEPLVGFWRDLILSIARHFHVLFLAPSQVSTLNLFSLHSLAFPSLTIHSLSLSKLKRDWFNRGGLTPLCLDHVLLEMYKEGLIVRSEDLADPTTGGRFSYFYRRVRNLMTTTMTPDMIAAQQDDIFIVIPVLKDKAGMVVKQLAEAQWSGSVVVTMSRFQAMCDGDSASAVLSYLSTQGRARYFALNKGGVSIQGVKVSLLDSPASSVSGFDCDVLHLIWTAEMLEQQLGVIDQRSERSKKSALASMNSGNKSIALRHMRALKSANESREKCYTLLNRVEEVLNVIANAESTKKASEAIKIGARAIKENNVSVKEVEESLQELEESIDLQKQIENALDSTVSYTLSEDEDIEAEFEKLELEIGDDIHCQPNAEVRASGETGALELSDVFSNLKVVDASSSSQDIPVRETKKIQLEAA